MRIDTEASPPRRDVLVQVRLTTGERARWKVAACTEDLRLSEFIRVAVRSRIENGPHPVLIEVGGSQDGRRRG